MLYIREELFREKLIPIKYVFKQYDEFGHLALGLSQVFGI